MKRYKVTDDPYQLNAVAARVTAKALKISFPNGVIVEVPIGLLGEPWTSASRKSLANLRLESGGGTVWWDDLDEGLIFDEHLPAILRVNPAAMMGRLGRGTSTPKKAAAARINGRTGGRPRKKAA